MAACAAILSALFALPVPLRGDEIGSSDAPWFNMTGCHHPSRTVAQSHGVHDPDHRGTTICSLSISICGDVAVQRQTSIDSETQRCPSSMKYTSYPPRRVCCERWEAAKAPGSKCDGTVDADCDGIPNDQDGAPLTPNVAK